MYVHRAFTSKISTDIGPVPLELTLPEMRDVPRAHQIHLSGEATAKIGKGNGDSIQQTLTNALASNVKKK